MSKSPSHRKSFSMSVPAGERVKRYCAEQGVSCAGWLERLAMDAIDDAEDRVSRCSRTSMAERPSRPE